MFNQPKLQITLMFDHLTADQLGNPHFLQHTFTIDRTTCLHVAIQDLCRSKNLDPNKIIEVTISPVPF